MDWLEGMAAHWLWLMAGLVLAGLEIVIPGIYLIWLGMAAVVVGLMVLAADGLFGAALGPAVQVVSFVVLALVFTYGSRRWLKQSPIESADPMLNNRTGQLLGETALVTQAIAHGSGRVKLGDSEWSARGADTPAGGYVRVSGAEGSVLLVEPAAG